MHAQAHAHEPRLEFDRRLTPVRIHHAAVQGRTRLKLESLRDNSDLMAALAQRVRRHAQVREVSANPRSASMLVLHDTALRPEDLAAIVRNIWRQGVDAAASPLQAGAPAWHAKPANAVLEALSAPNGLSEAEAQTRMARDGENRLPEAPARSAFDLLIGQFKSVPVGLLGASAALSFATGGLADAALTLAVIALNAGIGVSTQSWTDQLVRRLTRVGDGDVEILRDGVASTQPASRIARGDWLVLKSGAAIAADARLITADGLSVDESVLTGESLPAEKDSAALISADAPLAARRTMVHRGGVVISGQGLAIVTATGPATELGRVRALLESTKAPDPPMARALDRLGVRLTIACLSASAVLALILRAQGAPWTNVARSAIALAVSAIPEGLPALAGASKVLAARAMARDGALVRNVNVIETAANLTILCLDKTGTLTENRMAVAEVRTLEAAFVPRLEPPPSEIQALAEIAALCSDAAAEETSGASSGSGTERALVDFAAELGVDVAALRAKHPRVATLNRSPRRLYMATEHVSETGRFVALKGAPHQVLALCSSVRYAGAQQPLSLALRAQLAAQNSELAGQGLRVLAIARADATALSDPPQALEWLGLVALADPLRPSAPAAVAAIQRAGLRTLILTGDQAATARKLAVDLGILRDGALEVVDASTLEGMTQAEIAAIASKAEVFARVSPSTKLAIIHALQGDGHIVAMTGDGVNDGPALRAADVGIAMGQSGADVAREVADIVIADDDLGSLTRLLARGRAADENLRRAVRFLLATNASEVALVLAEALSGPEAMETPAQLFWLNLMSDIFPALGLATARPADDILQRPPHPPGADIVGNFSAVTGDALRIAAPAMATHILARMRHGYGARTRGLTFLSLASRQLAHALRLAPGRPASDVLDRPLELGVAAAYLLLAAPFVISPLRRVLKLAPPTLIEAGLIVGFSFAPLAARLTFAAPRSSDQTRS